MKSNKLTKTVTIVNIILIFGSLSIFPQTNTLNNSKWKLNKIEDKVTGDVYLSQAYYFIGFNNGTLSYSLQRNNCGGTYEVIDSNKIEIKTGPCTKICCDRDLSDLINYAGVVEVKVVKDRLILITGNRIYYFDPIS